MPIKNYIDKDGALFIFQKIKLWLAGKVDKVEGKGLSTNDFTDDYKQKVDTLSAGGAVTDFEDLTNIPENLKPYETLVHDANYNHTDNNYTDADKAKIQGLPATVGDMTKATYDTDGDGIVDQAANAQKVNNLTVETAVPPSAVFTDTTYSPATTSEDGLMSAADKTKLNGIAENANNFVLEEATSTTLGGVKIGAGVNVTDDGTISVNIPAVPTKVSDLTNDSGFQTASDVSSAITEALGDIDEFKIVMVGENEELPSPGIENTFYFKLLPTSEQEDGDLYEEFIYINGAYEPLGKRKIDLTGYWSKTELVALTNSDLEELITQLEGA